MRKLCKMQLYSQCIPFFVSNIGVLCITICLFVVFKDVDFFRMMLISLGLGILLFVPYNQ